MHEPDMSPAAVAGRLRELARLSLSSRLPRSVDMSPLAIERRLRTLGKLHRACLVLGEAGRRAGLGRPGREAEQHDASPGEARG